MCLCLFFVLHKNRVHKVNANPVNEVANKTTVHANQVYQHFIYAQENDKNQMNIQRMEAN